MITSLQNSRVKHVVRLRQRGYRDSEKCTVIEGVRECRQALRSGFQPVEAFICPDVIDAAETADIAAQLEGLARSGHTRILNVSAAVFAKMAYRGDTGGLLLVVPYWPCHLSDLPQTAVPFFVVVENVEKPGNFGALLRTADAAGVDGVIACYHGGAAATDLFNPNVIRASLGAVFTIPVAVAPTVEALAWLHSQAISIVAATPDAATRYTAVDMTGATAVVIGSEAYGLTELWLDAAAWRVRIPMFGSVDSLNLSVSTALLLYEVVRQRHL